MITIYINNQPQTLTSDCTLQDVMQQHHALEQPMAVAVNQRFIPRGLFADTRLQNNDRIDLIAPMQGG
jgi:sulfur carrier protein